MKQEVKAKVKAEVVDPAVTSDGKARVKDADWEPGTWCWLLDDAHNWNSAPVVAVKSEAAAVKREEEAVSKEEERKKKTEQDENNVASTSQLASSLSSSRSIKEETNKENTTNNTTKLLCREDAEGNENGMCQSEHDAAAIISSVSQFVVSSVAAKPSTTGSRSQKEELEEQQSQSRPHVDDNDEDATTNNLKICHSTNRSVGATDPDPDPCDDTWRAGSWCWVSSAPKSGSRSDIVTSVASGSICSKRNKKRKASQQ